METIGGLENLGLSGEEAFALTRAAVLLDQSRLNRGDNKALAAALDNNLEVWVAIRTLIDRPEHKVPDNIRNGLSRLSNFIIATTFREGANISDSGINTLININLQISEGLLEGAKRTQSS